MSNQTLYRYWQEEKLLYIGISINAYSRAKQHQVTAKWWPEATHVTFEKFPNRGAVEQAEKDAIKNEKPLYNVMHNGPKQSTEIGRGDYNSAISGLWGFDLITERIDESPVYFPGRVYQIKNHIDGETYLVDFYQVTFTHIGKSQGMRPTKISDLVDPHFFETKKEMVYEFNDWWREHNFWADRYHKRAAAKEARNEKKGVLA